MNREAISIALDEERGLIICLTERITHTKTVPFSRIVMHGNGTNLPSLSPERQAGPGQPRTATA